MKCKFCNYEWSYNGVAIIGQYCSCPMCKGSNKILGDN